MFSRKNEFSWTVTLNVTLSQENDNLLNSWCFLRVRCKHNFFKWHSEKSSRMSLPGGGIFVVKGEMSVLLTAMRRGARWSSHSYQDDEVDNLMKNFQELKETLNKIADLRDIEPNVFLTPFLNVIKSDETTGPVTSLALSSVNKFLSYGLITRLVGELIPPHDFKQLKHSYFRNTTPHTAYNCSQHSRCCNSR